MRISSPSVSICSATSRSFVIDGDEIAEHDAHDRATGLLGEQQHLEHAVGYRIGQVFLRAPRARRRGRSDARPARHPRERVAQRQRTVLAELVARLGERPSGGDRREHVAQRVGPRGLHVAVEPRAAARAK